MKKNIISAKRNEHAVRNVVLTEDSTISSKRWWLRSLIVLAIVSFAVTSPVMMRARRISANTATGNVSRTPREASVTENLDPRSRTAGSMTNAALPPAPPSFSPGNLVIYRPGDGAAALGSNGTAVFLDEYTTGGVLVQSIPVPTTTVGAQRRLVCSGSATTEGYLTRSDDGQYVVFSGYDAALGAASIATSTSATVPRVIG